MRNIRSNEKGFDLLENNLPRISNFTRQWKEIEWRHPKDNTEELVTADGIIIVRVAGFSNSGFLRKHLNDLLKLDLSELKRSLSVINVKTQIKILESLIGQIDDTKHYVVLDFQLEQRVFKKFNRYYITELSEKQNKERNKIKIPGKITTEKGPLNKNQEHTYTISDELILKSSESFALDFINAMDDIKLKLLLIMNETEEREENLTFFYIHSKEHPDRLHDLYDSLCKKEFLLKGNNERKDFTNFFSGKNPNETIKWQTHYQDLSFFIRCLKEKEQLSNPGNCWEKTCKWFTDKDGATIEKTNLSKTHVSSKSTLLEAIISAQLQIKPKTA